MSTTIDNLVEDLERSYRETQERMSDPAVYNDRREAAQIGRRLKQLEEPHRLAEEWRQARADLDAARDDPELGGLVPDLVTTLMTAPPARPYSAEYAFEFTWNSLTADALNWYGARPEPVRPRV